MSYEINEADATLDGNAIYRAGGTDIPVTDGGTGASTAAGARTGLGLVIGTDVQAHNANLDDVADLAVTNGNFMVANGSAWAVKNGATARTSMGVGTASTPTFAGVTITGDTVIATETPATAAATGTAGQIAWDADYIYICTATDTWRRVAIATW